MSILTKEECTNYLLKLVSLMARPALTGTDLTLEQHEEIASLGQQCLRHLRFHLMIPDYYKLADALEKARAYAVFTNVSDASYNKIPDYLDAHFDEDIASFKAEEAARAASASGKTPDPANLN